jgi:hypothetical protein
VFFILVMQGIWLYYPIFWSGSIYYWPGTQQRMAESCGVIKTNSGALLIKSGLLFDSIVWA